jgi:hypothetical protein
MKLTREGDVSGRNRGCRQVAPKPTRGPARRAGVEPRTLAVVADIREAGPDDWARIYPSFAAVMTAGETYAYPDDLSLEEARPWWMEQPPGRTDHPARKIYW